MPSLKFDINEAKLLGTRLGLDFKTYSIEQFLEGLNHELEHSDITSGDPDLTAKIAIKHLEEDPQYYIKLSKIEKKNSKPQIYYCKHIEPGIVAYDTETLLINNDTLKNMNLTFKGLPVYVYHVDNVDYSKIQEADGYVIESFYNKLDNWNWCKFIIVSDEGHAAVNKGWSVSNSYMPTKFGKGGEYHAIPYDKEVLDGYYTHLAIVPDPRYESAKIMTEEQYLDYCQKKQAELDKTQAVKELTNSNTNGGVKKMKFNFFKKVEVKNADELQDAFIEIDGKEVSIAEMATALQNAKKNEDDSKKKNDADMDAKVKVGDNEMSVKELVSKYNKLKKNEDAEDNEDDKDDKKNKKKNKKNEDEDDNCHNEDEDEDAENEDYSKKNEDEEDNEEETEEEAKREKEEGEVKKDKKNKAKKNARSKNNYYEMMNAHLKDETAVEVIETTSAMLARGHSKYGTKE